MEGIDQVLARIDNIERAMIKGAILGTAKAGKHIQGKAKELAPVDFGQLRNSIISRTEVRENEVESEVSTNVEHAIFQEFGTGQKGASSPSPPKSNEPVSYREDWEGIPAQPFMYPAMISEKDNAKKIVAHSVKEELRGV